MPEIFLSYRRADAPRAAERLFGDLSQRFGAPQVFRDVESIEAGEHFEHAISDAIGTAGAVLVVMGPRWLESRAADGARRLDDPLDYVRREVELALSLETAVIPVLVENATFPAAASLPPSLRELATRNAIALSDARWTDDVEILLSQLERSGIPVAASDRPRQEALRGASDPAIRAAFTGFVPNLFALLRQPKRFLRRCAGGKVVDLTRAFVFFTLAMLLAIVILVSGYTPTQPVASFALTVFTVSLVGTVALSMPLWVAWRVVGAKRHYARLLTILLHQVAVLHLGLLIVFWIVIVALDLQSLNFMSDMIAEAMKTGHSVGSMIPALVAAIEPVADSGLLLTAGAIGVLVVLGLSVWFISSWGAYRQTFELSRTRSAAAFVLFILPILLILISALAALLVAFAASA